VKHEHPKMGKVSVSYPSFSRNDISPCPVSYQCQCFIEDKYTGKILTTGHKHQVLYALDSGGVVQALGAINLAKHLWTLAPTTWASSF
jgi:hypothetical protein